MYISRPPRGASPSRGRPRRRLKNRVARLTARPVGTPLSKVRVRASHGRTVRRPEPVYRPLTRGPTLIDGRPQRVGVGLGSRALLGAVAVSTAGLAGSPEGPTLVATLRPHRPWIGGAGRYGGHQARVRSHRPWSGAVRGAWPQAVTRAGADEGSEAEGSRSHLRTEVRAVRGGWGARAPLECVIQNLIYSSDGFTPLY